MYVKTRNRALAAWQLVCEDDGAVSSAVCAASKAGLR